MHKTIAKQPQHRDKPHFSDRQQRIYDFLAAHPIGVLATVTPDGDPHGVVIYYKLGKDFSISLLTKSGTRKYDNIKHHDRVMLTVFEAKTQTTAQVMGRATEVTDGYELDSIAGSILATSLKTSKPGLPPIAKFEAGEYVAFKIMPSQIRMAAYAKPDQGEYTEIFESLESFVLDDNVD